MLSDANFVQIALSRHSTGGRHQRIPAPDVAELRLAVSTALRAPNHEKKLPFRFVEIKSRDKLADLFESTLPADADEAVREKTRSKAHMGPMCVAMVLTDINDDISPMFKEERLLTTGAGMMNFQNALHSMCYVSKVVSPRSFEAPDGLYDPLNERLICFILIGSPEEPIDYSKTPIGEDTPLPLTQW